MILLTQRRPRYLVANTSWPTGDTGILSVGVAPRQVCVGRALHASVGVSVNEETGGAGNASGTCLLGVVGHQSARATRRRHSIHGVCHTDGVQLHHVADVTANLQTHAGRGSDCRASCTSFTFNALTLADTSARVHLRPAPGWSSGRPTCM